MDQKLIVALLLVIAPCRASSGGVGALSVLKAGDVPVLSTPPAVAEPEPVPQAAPTPGKWGISPEAIELLKNTQFTCDVVSVRETRKGKVVSDYRPEGRDSFTTANWEGEPYHKHADIPTVLVPSGEKGWMGFGGFIVNKPGVVLIFNEKRLLVVIREYDWRLDFNLETGAGEVSYGYTAIDWDSVTNMTGEAVLSGCRIVKN